VGRGWSPHVGFMSGWILIRDYALIPTVTSVSASPRPFPFDVVRMMLKMMAGAIGIMCS
jgi:hypothetical protein